MRLGLVIGVLLLSGCAVLWGVSNHDRREQYIQEHPGLSSAIVSKIREGSVNVGMTTEDVLASWGAPEHRNTTGGSAGSSEQWIYHQPDARYFFYFSDGKLDSFQKFTGY